MFIVGIFSWWYGAGWKAQLKGLEERLARLGDFFSIGILANSLFSPFRQIASGRVQGPLGVQLQALADNLISRCIGAMIRSALIVAGLVSVVAVAIIGFILLLLWPLVPLLPIIGLGLTLIGWLPWQP